jgi:type IV pilus assembly protein PilC
MPLYEYKAKKTDGQITSGTEQAKNEEDLAKKLHKKDLALVSIESGGGESKRRKGIVLFGGKVKLTDKMMFTRHLAVMISTGFPFDKSLDVLSRQTKNEKFQGIIENIKERIVKGETFSEALKKHPKIFDELYVNMVAVGEETGTLKDVLNALADQMKKDNEVRGKVKGAMMYPAILVSLMTVVGLVMMVYILPKFSKMFKEMDIEISIITQIILGIGDYLATYWYLIPVVVAVFVFAILRFKKTKRGKEILDNFYLKAPVVGPLLKKLNTARTARIFSSLIKSGVPIVKSLNILSKTLTNKLYRDAIKKTADGVQRGKNLRECLKNSYNIYPHLFIQMLEVGEETGRLGEVLADIAEFYEGEVDTITKNLSSIIEPILMVIIGVAVAVFAISIVQPMYSMMGQI